MTFFKNLKDIYKEESSKVTYHIKLSILIGCIVHLLAVIFSEGYHRPDEHLGLIRFMSFKMNLFPESKLSWEYPAQIRPWLHPALLYGQTKFLNLLGVENPFHLAFFYRLLSSLLGLFSSYLLLISGIRFFKKDLSKIILSYGLFNLSFLAFFHARMNAEHLGIAFFIFGLYPLLKNTPIEKEDRFNWNISHKLLTLSGLLLGISFILRFQMGIMVFMLLLFLLIKDWKKLPQISVILGGIFLAIGLSTIIDYWGYGEWTFAPWNYFYNNLILKKAAGFGISPFYYYFEKVLLRGIPPLSFFFIGGFLWFWIKRPLHLFSLLTWPFFLVHSFIGHKELRFIFCLAPFLPLIWAYFLDQVNSSALFEKKWVRIICYLAIFQNFSFALISSTKPALNQIGYYRHIYQKKERIDKIYTLGVYRDQLKFYLKSPIELVVSEKKEDVLKVLKSEKGVKWFLADRSFHRGIFMNRPNCHLDYLSYPKWILDSGFSNQLKKLKVWSLYRCE